MLLGLNWADCILASTFPLDCLSSPSCHFGSHPLVLGPHSWALPPLTLTWPPASFCPQYLGDRVSERVRTKVIELLFSWTLALPEESKIKDAYHMLKRQGLCSRAVSVRSG